MAFREIRIVGDPVLRTPCAPIKEITPGVRSLVEDLLENVNDEGRAGLAANQIGVSLRAFSWNIDGEIDYILNPVIVELSEDESQDEDEGCLSVSELWFPRSVHEVRAGRGEADPDSNSTRSLMAAYQHEVDDSTSPTSTASMLKSAKTAIAPAPTASTRPAWRSTASTRASDLGRSDITEADEDFLETADELGTSCGNRSTGEPQHRARRTAYRRRHQPAAGPSISMYPRRLAPASHCCATRGASTSTATPTSRARRSCTPATGIPSCQPASTASSGTPAAS